MSGQKKRVLHPTSRLNCISSYRGILGFDTKILQNNSGDAFHAELDLFRSVSRRLIETNQEK